MKPRVLILYYSFTDQTRRVSEVMAKTFKEEGCEANECAIEFIDDRYRIEFPFKPFWPRLLRWIWPQILGKAGTVRVPKEVTDLEYDLICLGSPTWWLKPAMPVTSILKSQTSAKLLQGKPFAVFTVCRSLWWINLRIVKKLARRQGGTFLDSATFRFQGNQLQSALSFINYMQTKVNPGHFCGVKIYDFGLPREELERAAVFARRLAKDLESIGSKNASGPIQMG